MKRLFVLTLVALFAFGTYTEARTRYDETGRHIIYDGTLRGHKRAAQQRAMEQKAQAAAAARINYEQNATEEAPHGYVKTGRVQPITKTVGVVRK